jgi:molybdopterin/thiamine biosynthesis adenylyltransferase
MGPLKFDESQLGYLSTVASVGSLLGVMIYYAGLNKANLRWLFFFVLIFSCLVSLTQLVLVSRVNVKWGISDFWFAFGDEAINSIVSNLIQMPMLIVCAKLCPPGVEATLYSFMTVVNNVAGSVASNLSAILTEAFAVTLTNFDKLSGLVVLCAITSLVPIAFLLLIPKSVDEWGPDKPGKKSKVGGVMVVVLVGVSLLFSVIQALVKMNTTEKKAP